MSLQPLVAGPRSHLSAAVVQSALDNPHPQIRWGVDVLDADLEETGETLPVDADAGGEVSWDYRVPDSHSPSATSVSAVRRQATLNLTGPVDDGLIVSRLFRLWVEQRATSGVWVRWHQGVFLSTLPARTFDGQRVTRQLQLAPREHLWATRTLDDWQTVAGDADVFDVIRDDLETVFGVTATAFPTPTGETTPQEDMTFEAGTSYLAKWRRLANSIGYDQPITDVDGLATSEPLDVLAGRGVEITYGPGTQIVPAAQVEPVDPELPNVVRFVARRGPSLPEEGNGWVTFRNESDGPASIESRGFEVFRLVQADASNQAELEAFAAAEVQRWMAGGGDRIEIQVGLNPRLNERDVVRLRHPPLGVDATCLKVAHRLPLRRLTGADAALMSVTLERRVAATQDEVEGS